MVEKINLRHKTAALMFVIIGAAVFGTSIVRGFVYVPTGEVRDAPALKTANTEQGLPERIRIPKLDVDADVEHVGITYKGNMSTPKNIAHTGWYKYGTPPGSLGSAVIAGHVDNGFNLPGVFANLKHLEIEDDVYVTTDAGAELHFIVVDKKTFPYKEVPRQELFAQADAVRLNLVTCEGDWINEEETAENRLIIFTRLVE